MQLAFALLISLQFAFILLHDLVDIPGLAQSKQLRTELGVPKLLAATLVNSAFPALAMIYAWHFWTLPRPTYVDRYWLIYCSVTVASAIAMWYIPYLRGATAEKCQQYQRLYANTLQILPVRGQNPRPNLLHVIFHLLFATNLILAIAINGHRH